MVPPGDVTISSGGHLTGTVNGQIYISDNGFGHIQTTDKVSVTGSDNIISGSNVYATGERFSITGGTVNATGVNLNITGGNNTINVLKEGDLYIALNVENKQRRIVSIDNFFIPKS